MSEVEVVKKNNIQTKSENESAQQSQAPPMPPVPYEYDLPPSLEGFMKLFTKSEISLPEALLLMYFMDRMFFNRQQNQHNSEVEKRLDRLERMIEDLARRREIEEFERRIMNRILPRVEAIEKLVNTGTDGNALAQQLNALRNDLMMLREEMRRRPSVLEELMQEADRIEKLRDSIERLSDVLGIKPETPITTTPEGKPDIGSLIDRVIRVIERAIARIPSTPPPRREVKTIETYQNPKEIILKEKAINPEKTSTVGVEDIDRRIRERVRKEVENLLRKEKAIKEESGELHTEGSKVSTGGEAIKEEKVREGTNKLNVSRSEEGNNRELSEKESKGSSGGVTVQSSSPKKQ